jgi:hypothetical protein
MPRFLTFFPLLPPQDSEKRLLYLINRMRGQEQYTRITIPASQSLNSKEGAPFISVAQEDVSVGYLEDKVVAGANVTVTKVTAGDGTQTLVVAAAAAAGAITHRGSTVATGGVWEAVTGLVNGANLRFDTANPYKAGSLLVFQNGKHITPVSGYTETTPASGRFDMIEAPYAGEEISVQYEEP